MTARAGDGPPRASEPPTAGQGRVADALRLRGTAQLLALAAGLLLFGHLGWDDALWDPHRQLALHALAVGAIVAIAWAAWRRTALPRTRVDLPILALLAAFALATASAQNPGVSLSAMAAIAGTAAMLPVALVVLDRRPAAAALSIALPVLALAASSLVELVARRVAWYAAGAPGLIPPVRLPGESTPFGSVAVPPFILLALVPLTLLVPDGLVRRATQVAMLVVGLPLTVLSGSRSAWLAIGVTAAILAVPIAWRRRGILLSRGRWTARRVLAAAGVLVLLAAGVAIAAPRLTAVTSLIYRGNLWRDTLAAWLTDPLLGIGPGLMPWARQAAAEPFTFGVRQPHSHNLPIGILGDAGVVGLAAAVIAVAAFAWVAGPWRSRTARGRVAGAVLCGLGVAGLFEDLSFLPGFSLLVVLLAALALADAGAVTWRRLPSLETPGARLGWASAGVAALVLLAAMVVGDAGAIAYRTGTDAAARGEWADATRWLARSLALDPWHPTTPKALAVAADGAGMPELARAAAERAVSLNGGDGASWANLAVLCEAAGDDACASDAAARATERASFFGLELINAALVFERLGDTRAADAAYLRSLLTNQSTSLAVTWPRRLALDDASVAELDAQARELNLLLARVSQGEPTEATSIADPAVRSLALAIEGDEAAVREALAEARENAPTSVLTWDLSIVLSRYWGQPYDRYVEIGRVVRGDDLAPPGIPIQPPSRIFDIAAFRAYPRDGLVAGAEHLTAATPYPWTLVRLLPARGP
jgi:tetratricopeptide (TPR) repeat protein